MRRRSWSLQKKLRDLPRYSSLENYVKTLMKEKGDRVESIVLFGSMAKGNYTKFSDYDLLIIVSRESLSFKDRLYEYSLYSDGWVEPFTYTKEEVEKMFREFNPLILDALKDGIIIYDKTGFWKDLKKKFNKLLSSGTITPKKNGWIIKHKNYEYL